jgi:cysteinyl-tRNA synthetase
MDWETQQELSDWFAAKDDKDYGTADNIRASLRAKGIEPDTCERPSASSGGNGTWGKSSGRSSGRAAPYGAKSLDADTEAQLEEWRELKRAKDYEAADALRSELRARGINPEQH